MKHLRIKVFPGCTKDYIQKLSQQQWKVYCKAPAADNLANMRAVQLVAQDLDIPDSWVRIISGHRQQNKMLEIREIED